MAADTPVGLKRPRAGRADHGTSMPQAEGGTAAAGDAATSGAPPAGGASEPLYGALRQTDDAPTIGRIRRLGHLAVALVWRASPRGLAGVVAVQLVAGALTAAQVLLGQRILAGILRTDRNADLAGLLPDAVLLTACVAAVGFAGVVQREGQRLLGEVVGQYTLGQILDLSATVELAAFDRPQFHDRLQRARINAEVRPVQMVTGLLTASGALLGVLAVGAALVALSPLVAVLVAACAVPLWVAAIRSSRALYRFSYQMTPNDRERAYVAELLTGKDAASEVRSFGLRDHLRHRFEALGADRIGRLRPLVAGRLVASLAANGLYALAVTAVVAGVVWLGARGTLPVTQAGAAVVAIALLGQRLSAATSGATQLYESALFLTDYAAFLQLRDEIGEECPGRREAPASFARIEVDDVSYQYPSGTRALHGVSLTIPAGSVVALVGENGSGKTTLAKLLAGLYQPTSGRIRWDGTDLAGVDLAQLRESVAVIFQDFVRYRFTAAESIGFGRVARLPDSAAVQRAARQAGADEFLAGLPDGYRTRLGPEFHGGHDLSIGQWQRVALARAYFRDAPLVILDEPTAALDPRAEQALFESIRTLLAGRTVVLISHRFASARSADRIFVLARGQVAESGTHDELMAAGGLYTELFTLQADAYRAPSRPAPRPTPGSSPGQGHPQ